MSKPTPTCPICNYSLVGIEPDEARRLTCPECGTLLKPASPNSVFTKKQFHLLFLYILVIPTLIASLAGLVGVFVPFEVGIFILAFHALVNPLILLALLIIVSAHTFVKSKQYPRPEPRWSIPLWGLLYCLPGTAMYFAVFYVFERSGY